VRPWHSEGITREPTDFFTMCKQLFGSRVAEHVLGFVASRVGKNPEEALLENLNAPLKAGAYTRPLFGST